MNRSVTPSHTPRSQHGADPADTWYFTADQIAHCPSARDGMKRHHIEEKRQRGCDFIMEVSKELNLEIRAKATVMLYFHRFFQLNSFTRFSSTEVASTCLFLGTKVEDFRLPLRECVLVSLYIRSGRQMKYTDTSPEFLKLHNVISNLEMVVLCALRFDFVVEHPYDTILKICKNLKLPDDKKNAIAQGAWNFVNDNLGSTLALRYKSGMIAVAALQLSARRCETTLDWKEDLKVLDEKAQADHYEIMHSILEVYEGQQQQQHQHHQKKVVAPPPPPRAPAGVLTPNPEANSSQSPLGATSGMAPEPLSATSATATVPAATATKTEGAPSPVPPPNPPLPQDPPLPPSEPQPPLPPPPVPSPHHRASSGLKADSAKALHHQRPSPYSRPRDADIRVRAESKEEGEL